MRLFSLFIFFNTSLVFGQIESRQLTLNGGASHNLMRFVHTADFRDFSHQYNFTPGLLVSADLGVFSFLSVGVSFTAQRHILSVSDYSYQNGAGNMVTENATLNMLIGGGQLRVLIHPRSIVNDDNLDFYYGIHGSVRFYKTTTTSSDPNFYAPSSDLKTIFCGVIGVRYFLTTQLGLFAEGALPGPYTLSVGLTMRIGPDPIDFKGWLLR